MLEHTGAAAVMIGRAAQGNPWIFQQINHYLEQGQLLAPPSIEQAGHVMTRHLQALHKFYGDVGGVRISRKHIGWYINPLPGGKDFTQEFNKLQSTEEQQMLLSRFFQSTEHRNQAA